MCLCCESKQQKCKYMWNLCSESKQQKCKYMCLRCEVNIKNVNICLYSESKHKKCKYMCLCNEVNIKNVNMCVFIVKVNIKNEIETGHKKICSGVQD